MPDVIHPFPGRRLSRRSAISAVVGAGFSAALAACGGDSPAEQGTKIPSTSAGASLRWRQISAGDGPSARKDHSLAYDAGTGTAYLFGGRAAGNALGDLWSLDLQSNSWRRVEAAGGAPARFGHNAFFDEMGRRLVVFGGQAGTAFFNDVWAFSPGAGWQQLAAEAGPSPRYGAGGAVDPTAGIFYVTHGFTFQGRFDDTWRLALAEASWRNASPSGEKPLARCLVRAVWDEEAKALLLFGGQSNRAPFHDDFWRLAPGGPWTEVKAQPKPSARNLYAAGYDAAGKRLLLFGGRTSAGNADDIWAYSAATNAWTKLEAGPGPSPRNGHDAVYLPDRKALLVFAGAADSGELNDLWVLELSA